MCSSDLELNLDFDTDLVGMNVSLPVRGEEMGEEEGEEMGEKGAEEGRVKDQGDVKIGESREGHVIL